VISGLAVHLAASFDARAAKLRPGEKAYVLAISVDQAQSAIVFNMAKAFFETLPTLKAMVKSIGKDSIELANGVVVEIKANSYRPFCGRRLLAVIAAEIAFWRDETSSTPDVETYTAVRPGLARVPNSMLLMISTAHRRSGLLYERFEQYYGSDS